MDQSPSWEANRFSSSHENTHILWNPKVHNRIHKCPPPVPIKLIPTTQKNTPSIYYQDRTFIQFKEIKDIIRITYIWRVLHVKVMVHTIPITLYRLILCSTDAECITPALSFIHSVFCLTTGPKPPPKLLLHLVRSRASSFKWEYPLLSLTSSSSFLRLLPRLLVFSISPFIFPSITCFRRQFLRKMWPIQLASRFLISCRIFLCWALW